MWHRRVTLRDVWPAGLTQHLDRGDSIFDVIEFVIALPFLVIAAIGMVVSLVDLVFQLVALPFAVLARLVWLTSWPVQLVQTDAHVCTDRVKGFGAAEAHRDAMVVEVREGGSPSVRSPSPRRGAAPAARPQ